MTKVVTGSLLFLTIFAYAGMGSVDWRFGTLRDQYVTQTLGWYGLVFVLFVLLVVWLEWRQAVDLRWVWGIAIGVRLLLLLTTPTLSDDVYRYLWDGHVAAQGVSPDAFAIDSAELNPFDHPIRALANNRSMASPYMPAAQTVFHLAARLFPLTPLTMQAIMVTFDLLTAVLISKLLTLANLPARRITLYLLNPLIILEVAHGAHIDAWMILLLLLAVYFTLHGGDQAVSTTVYRELDFSVLSNQKFGRWIAPITLALAVLTKIIPVLAAPVFFWHWSWRQRIGSAVLALGLLVPAGRRAGWGLAGELNGRGVFGALRIYAARWNFNSGIFHWLEQWLIERGSVTPLETAKLVVWLLIMGVLLAVWGLAYRYRSPRSALRLLFIPFAAYLSLTPTVHPWYALIMLTFVPFLAPASDESRWQWLLVLPWFYLAATLPLSYLTYRDPNDFREFEWVRQTEWLPTLALATIGLLWKSWTHFSAQGYDN
ncbi:MAG TPA: hypothetical protein ENJ56_01965 [Anaerolineae bacterium]|nr:hypothetical protein [Anaerolineae bacterium]